MCVKDQWFCSGPRSFRLCKSFGTLQLKFKKNRKEAQFLIRLRSNSNWYSSNSTQIYGWWHACFLCRFLWQNVPYTIHMNPMAICFDVSSPILVDLCFGWRSLTLEASTRCLRDHRSTTIAYYPPCSQIIIALPAVLPVRSRQSALSMKRPWFFGSWLVYRPRHILMESEYAFFTPQKKKNNHLYCNGLYSEVVSQVSKSTVRILKQSRWCNSVEQKRRKNDLNHCHSTVYVRSNSAHGWWTRPSRFACRTSPSSSRIQRKPNCAWHYMWAGIEEWIEWLEWLEVEWLCLLLELLLSSEFCTFLGHLLFVCELGHLWRLGSRLPSSHSRHNNVLNLFIYYICFTATSQIWRCLRALGKFRCSCSVLLEL